MILMKYYNVYNYFNEKCFCFVVNIFSAYKNVDYLISENCIEKFEILNTK